MRSCYESAEKRYVIGTREPVFFFFFLLKNQIEEKIIDGWIKILKKI